VPRWARPEHVDRRPRSSSSRTSVEGGAVSVCILPVGFSVAFSWLASYVRTCAARCRRKHPCRDAVRQTLNAQVCSRIGYVPREGWALRLRGQVATCRADRDLSLGSSAPWFWQVARRCPPTGHSTCEALGRRVERVIIPCLELASAAAIVANRFARPAVVVCPQVYSLDSPFAIADAYHPRAALAGIDCRATGILDAPLFPPGGY
jgi:hypothetical protein